MVHLETVLQHCDADRADVLDAVSDGVEVELDSDDAVDVHPVDELAEVRRKYWSGRDLMGSETDLDRAVLEADAWIQVVLNQGWNLVECLMED